jgi:LacI family transcriptional regulator, xylobiose transport system transcriptional regulator
MAAEPAPRRRGRGEIETLPSGSLRVRVYAGMDPQTRKRRYLVETVPAGPGAQQRAEEVRARLLTEVQQHTGLSRRTPVGAAGRGRTRPAAASVEVVLSGVVSHSGIELMRGVKDTVVGRGYAVGFTDMLHEASTGRNWAEDLLARRPAGIVVVNTGGTPEQQGLLSDGSAPVVLVDPLGEPAPGVPAVSAANRSGAAAAAQYLLDLGHERIAVISGPTERWNARARLAGIRAVLDGAALPLDDRLLRPGRWFSFEDGYNNGRDLLRLPRRPTAVLCGNDMQAFGVYEAARAAGVRIPEELSVVGFDDISYAVWCGPKLTTVRQPFADMGATAARMVLALADGERVSPARVELATTLVVRDSTAAAPA